MRKTILIFCATILLLFNATTRGDEMKNTTQKLEHGMVQLYDFGDLKLHAYQTNDPMNDECFLLESEGNLVAIESPAFEKNIDEWKGYVGKLGKPLTDVLISYHPNGGKWYGNARSHSTGSGRKSIGHGGATRQLAMNLAEAFGREFNTDIPEITDTLKTGRNEIGGIEFIVTDVADGYEIEIPAINVVYTHMLGADCHSILPGVDVMNATIDRLEGYKTKKFVLILSSHHTPETIADVDAKIEYVKTVKSISEESKDGKDFVLMMKEKYPKLHGENYLDMSAAALFQ